jgi:hypothetical protein
MLHTDWLAAKKGDADASALRCLTAAQEEL